MLIVLTATQQDSCFMELHINSGQDMVVSPNKCRLQSTGNDEFVPTYGIENGLTAKQISSSTLEIKLNKQINYSNSNKYLKT